MTALPLQYGFVAETLGVLLTVMKNQLKSIYYTHLYLTYMVAYKTKKNATG